MSISPHAPGDEVLCGHGGSHEGPCADEDEWQYSLGGPECGSCGACVCVRCYEERCLACHGNGTFDPGMNPERVECPTCNGTGSVPGDPAHYQGCDQGVAM